MSDDLIDPDSIPIPAVDPDALEDAAADLRAQGGNIAETGEAVKTSWSDLRDHYVAPEAETLFAVMDPVAEKGDEVNVDLGQVAAALETFAETARDLKAQLVQAKADAQDFRASIEGDDDWDEGGFFGGESDKVGEHNDLLNRVNSLVHRYWAAERDCANAITALFGGTRFVGAGADGGQPGAGESVYGTAEPFSGVETPWGSPQSTDHQGHVDLVHGAGDVLMGTLEDFGGAFGLHGDEGWLWQGGSWTGNLGGYWGDSIAGLGAMAGVYNPETGEFTAGLGEAWDVARGAWGDAIHGFFPWTELDERPGYVFGTALTNIGMIAGGIALSATGLGAVAGVPMITSRVTRILGSVGRGGDSSGGGDGSEGGDDAERRDDRITGATPEGGPQQVTRPENIEPGEGFDTSGIGDMSESLSRLNATRNAVPDQPAAPPAADLAPEGAPDPSPPPRQESTPEPEPDPETGEGPPEDRPSAEQTPEQRPEQPPERQSDQQPEQPPGQTAPRRDPTAEEVDDAFSEIARRNEDLADQMDDIDGGRMAELDGDAPWTIGALEDTGPDGGRGGPDDRTRVPVTPDGLEMSRNDPDGTEGTNSPGADPRPDDAGRPVEVTEDRPEQNPSTGGGGGGGDRPPGGGPPGGGGGGDGPSSPDEDRPDPERADGPMTPEQEAGVREVLRNSGLNANKVEEIVDSLRDGASGDSVGRQVADILLEGRVDKVHNFAEFVSDFSSPSMARDAAAELRFMDHLIDRGYPVDRLEFAEKKSEQDTRNAAENYDIDTFIRSDGSAGDYAYQIKHLDVQDGTIRGSQLVNNSKKIANQLRVVSGWENTRTVGIMEADAPLGEISEKQYRSILNNARRNNMVFVIYHRDGVLMIPPDGDAFPSLPTGR
ncbi:hypothetical protein LG943_05490 [Streptomonospora sp. S1-112]|uniref:Uncharacterized protein n=1 Tax=Streptomonospora mangrovi TaxID=2883123 RepID=A0A9X3NHI9_9ACTN|nr:hypothetical protein [Streptomonospora mangrovi]MDA0563782.1 hypothetical protein [Streptomonospora mangrovi]